MFHPSPSPTVDDVHSLTLTVLRRVRTLLKRRGLIDSKNDASESETIQAVRDLAPGFFANVDDEGRVALLRPGRVMPFVRQ